MQNKEEGKNIEEGKERWREENTKEGIKNNKRKKKNWKRVKISEGR